LSADIGVDPVFTAGRPFFFLVFPGHLFILLLSRRAKRDAGHTRKGRHANERPTRA